VVQFPVAVCAKRREHFETAPDGSRSKCPMVNGTRGSPERYNPELPATGEPSAGLPWQSGTRPAPRPRGRNGGSGSASCSRGYRQRRHPRRSRPWHFAQLISSGWAPCLVVATTVPSRILDRDSICCLRIPYSVVPPYPPYSVHLKCSPLTEHRAGKAVVEVGILQVEAVSVPERLEQLVRVRQTARTPSCRAKSVSDLRIVTVNRGDDLGGCPRSRLAPSPCCTDEG
jgi:hypothetical protein